MKIKVLKSKYSFNYYDECTLLSSSQMELTIEPSLMKILRGTYTFREIRNGHKCHDSNPWPCTETLSWHVMHMGFAALWKCSQYQKTSFPSSNKTWYTLC